MKATSQGTFQILGPQTSWKNPGQSLKKDTMSTYRLQKWTLHLQVSNTSNNLYISLPVQVCRGNEGRHPRLKLLHPGHEPASVCTQRWLSSSLWPQLYLLSVSLETAPPCSPHQAAVHRLTEFLVVLLGRPGNQAWNAHGNRHGCYVGLSKVSRQDSQYWPQGHSSVPAKECTHTSQK